MPRDPLDVINQILMHIPAESAEVDIHNAQLGKIRTKLEKLQKHVTYLPYESHYQGWRELVEILETSLHTPPVHEWEKAIQSITRNRTTPVVVIEDDTYSKGP